MRARQLEAALAFVLLLLIAYLITGYRPLVPAALGCGFLLGAFPALLSLFYSAWSRLLETVGKITGTLLLTAVYLLVFFPLSFFVRRSRRKTIVLKRGERTSGLVVREHTYGPEDLKNPW
ncbi:MAG TPA: hypothetical protein VHK69_05765 [Chitinophagaceae bacterium]|jgi:uncharacterized membrane protein|nr:hypothetical protein [Chitinophagaceae bacterium]